ncbi:unnamed protein product [Fusarium graminearum]|uniref:Uncharacterized protein n=1 Tax=Gibberella zeae (strain ATCC MYA-4620 / CBS 123657 / FGSC 9075 / NRRL 31084 / PH-1) TaxID=229533 RepID=A0A098DCV9_GIBZE|nr:unnamed protein product [Fusarium graminearum]
MTDDAWGGRGEGESAWVVYAAGPYQIHDAGMVSPPAILSERNPSERPEVMTDAGGLPRPSRSLARGYNTAFRLLLTYKIK